MTFIQSVIRQAKVHIKPFYIQNIPTRLGITTIYHRNLCQKQKPSEETKINEANLHHRMNQILFKSQNLSSSAKPEIESISAIPYTIRPTKIFTICGLIACLAICFIPKQSTIDQKYLLLWPSFFKKQKKSEKQSYTPNTLPVSMYAMASMFSGLIAGKYYEIRMNIKRNVRLTLFKLCHRAPLCIMHCGGFTAIIFYAVIGTAFIFECLANGQPYKFKEILNIDGLSKKTETSSLETQMFIDHEMQFGNEFLRGMNKKLSECEWSEILCRAKFAMELLSHLMLSSYFVVFPVFLGGGFCLILRHRKQWLALYSRLKK